MRSRWPSRGGRAWLLGALALGALALVPFPARAQAGLLERLGVERASATLEGASDPEERRAAAYFLGRHGAVAQASAALATAMVVETDRDVRIEIADAIARRGVPVASAAMAERIASATDEERRALLRALGAGRDERALEALALELGSFRDGALVADLLAAAGVAARSVLLEALADASRRVPALAVLGRLGDRSTAGEVAALLVVEEAPVRASAAAALARLGDPEGALPGLLASADEALAAVVLRALAGEARAPSVTELVSLAESRLAATEPATRASALIFLAAHAPERAGEALLAGLNDTPEVRTAVRDALRRSDAPELVLVARALAERSDPGTTARAEAVDFLVDARGGTGLGALVELGAPALALALALRRAPHAPDAARAFEALRSRASAVARDVLGALAGAPPEAEAWDPSDPLARAALGARAWLSPSFDGARLAAMLAAERDPRAFAWLARAAVAHRVPIDAEPLRDWLERPERRADALALVPSALAHATPRDARHLRREVSRALHARDARERATAAQTLGVLGATESAAALEALLHDPSETVRVAVVRALVALEPERAVELVLAEARAEHDRVSARRLLEALKASRPGDVLAVEVVLADPTATAPWLEVRSCDGTWLRLPALPGGLVIVPNVPCAQLDADLSL